MNRDSDHTLELYRIFLALALASCLIVMVGCQDVQVEGGSDNPYTLAQVEAMMGYHGALVARFDGKQWWFLRGRRWIPIEAGGAREYALNTVQRGPM